MPDAQRVSGCGLDMLVHRWSDCTSGLKVLSGGVWNLRSCLCVFSYVSTRCECDLAAQQWCFLMCIWMCPAEVPEWLKLSMRTLLKRGHSRHTVGTHTHTDVWDAGNPLVPCQTDVVPPLTLFLLQLTCLGDVRAAKQKHEGGHHAALMEQIRLTSSHVQRSNTAEYFLHYSCMNYHVLRNHYHYSWLIGLETCLHFYIM